MLNGIKRAAWQMNADGFHEKKRRRSSVIRSEMIVMTRVGGAPWLRQDQMTNKVVCSSHVADGFKENSEDFMTELHPHPYRDFSSHILKL